MQKNLGDRSWAEEPNGINAKKLGLFSYIYNSWPIGHTEVYTVVAHSIAHIIFFSSVETPIPIIYLVIQYLCILQIYEKRHLSITYTTIKKLIFKG
jgi:hypothetical protein